jgi:uncharacterized membrane protein
VAVLLHHPIRVVLLPVTAGGREIPSLWLQFMGVLGQLSIRLPRFLYTLWALAIVSGIAALATGARGRTGGRSGGRLVPPAAVIAILGSAELIFLALYVTWTPVGMARIDGIQGRYFIPLLPMLLFAVPGGLAWPRGPAWIWWVAPLAAILATDVTIPRLIAAHFYG